MRTLPSFSSVAVCAARASCIEAVGLKLLRAGSKISALASGPSPPVKRTWPLGSSVAVFSRRNSVIVPAQGRRKNPPNTLSMR